MMAYFIVPVQFSRKRALSPTEKAEYALTVNYYKSHCGAVGDEIEERAETYARESPEDISGRLRCHAATSGPGDWLTNTGAATWAFPLDTPTSRLLKKVS